jgi:hypothetical protein
MYQRGLLIFRLLNDSVTKKTPENRALLEKVTAPDLGKKFSIFSGS